MKKLLQYALAGLLLLAPVGMAVQLSDLSPSLDRQAADDNLTKDYAYRVLSDLSVRRIWNLDDNRKLTIDFDGKTGELICIAVDYRKPVSLADADKDAADIGKFEEAKWRKFSSDKAAKYYMNRARAMKFDEGYMFQELSAANKCMRLTFYTKIPKENRRLITEGDTRGGATVMGSTTSGAGVKTLLEDEEKRLYTPNKTDKPKVVVKDKPKKPKAAEPAAEEPKDEPVAVVEEPKETGKVVKAPIETVTQKGDRTSDFQKLLAKLGLDKLETMHWVIGGVALVVIITLLSAVGRGKERRKLEQRAAKLRTSSASVKASLRQKVNGDKSKLKLK